MYHSHNKRHVWNGPSIPPWNIHIYYIGIPKHEKHVTTSYFRYESFYYLWVKGFDIRKRDAHSFYDVFSICLPSRAAPIACKFVWPLRAPKVDPSLSVSSSQPTDFFRIPQNPPRTLPVHDVIHIPWSWDFYFDICERHILPARA